MKRIVIASVLLSVVGALAPWNGSAGAAAPEHRPDAPTEVRGEAPPTAATP